MADSGTARLGWRWPSARPSKNVQTAMIAALVVLGIVVAQWQEVTAISGPVFLQATLTGLLIGGVYGLVSMGMSLIFGVLHIVNFAHGAFMTVAMYATYLLVAHLGLDPYLLLLPVTAVLFVLGAGIQKVFVERTMGQPLENQLLLTLGFALVIENGLLVAFTATPQTMDLSYRNASFDLGPVSLSFPLSVFGAVATLERVLAFVGAVGLALVLYLLMKKTSLGTSVRAVADNPAGAAVVGINVERMRNVSFGAGTACAGAAGVLVLPFLSLHPGTGEMFTVLAFVIVVLGGMGSVVGALLGGLLIGMSQEWGALLFPGFSKMLPVFVVFVLTLFLRPEGLLGRGSD